MNTKHFFFSIALFMCIPFVSNAQIYVDSLGVVQVGNYELDIFDGLLPCERDSNICLSVKGYGDMWSGSKITFGDAGSNSMMNVSVGELNRVVGVTGIIDDTDRLWLHGKNGLYYTSALHSQDTVFYYDRYLNNDFHFNCNVLASNIALASDSRFKTDITPLESSLQTITSLTPVSYRLLPRFVNDADEIPTGTLSEKELQDIENARKFYQSLENDGPHFGFIAQEVKEIYPELVKTDHDGYMYIDYIGMIPLLVHAIGELNAQIEELKAENSELNQAVINAQAPAVGNGQPSQIADDFLRNALYQNRPNPFTTSTTISMSLRSEVTEAVLYIFDMQGSLLKTIPVTDRGNVSVTISGGELNAGMYIYSLIADGSEIASKRMILTK